MAIRSKSDSVFATFFMSMAVGRQKVTAITLPLSLLVSYSKLTALPRDPGAQWQ